MLKDLRFALRQLFKSPGFTFVAILTVALGIGANTAIFSVVNGVLINPLPYPDPNRIAVLFQQLPDFKDGSISYPNFLDWKRMNHSFSTLAAYRPTGFSLSRTGETQHFSGEMISAGLFEILGVKPVAGRTFKDADDHRGVAPTAMISERLWKSEFGGTRDILGRRLVLNGVGRTVVGVVPSSFRLHIENFQSGSLVVDIYTPIGEYNEPRFYDDRSAGWGMKALGRLKLGVSLDVARQDMNRVSRQLSAAYPNTDTNRGVYMLPLKEVVVGEMRAPLLVLLGAVFFVLLIASVNVSNLLLARSAARQREFAIRIAIGGGQWQIVRQLLTESMLLALLGGVAGLLLAQFGTAAALAFAPANISGVDQVRLDTHVLLFTLLCSLLTGCAFGIAPALKMRHANLSGTLKEAGRTVAGRGSRTQRLFVVTEMALALVLLIGSGLMIRTMFVLWRLNPGFNPGGVTTFSVALQPSLEHESPTAIRASFRTIHSQLAATAGVQAVSLSAASSPMVDDYDYHFWFSGRPRPAQLADIPMALIYVVEPDYLKTLQLDLVRGRFLEEIDSEQSSPVAVIDDSLARKYFPHEDAIGQSLDLDVDSSRPSGRPPVRIVGIVHHINQWGLDADSVRSLHSQIYLPIAQTPDKNTAQMADVIQVYVRGKGQNPPDFNQLATSLSKLSSELVSYGHEPMQQVVLDSIANKRFTMALLAAFAALALLLAGVGIYGVLSYFVGQRTREIGIRIALGAARGDVMGMIMADGARMVSIGITIGVIAAFAVTRVMSSVLFGVRPTDLGTFAAVILVLCCFAALACYVPARRAMRIDPLIALRDE